MQHNPLQPDQTPPSQAIPPPGVSPAPQLQPPSLQPAYMLQHQQNLMMMGGGLAATGNGNSYGNNALLMPAGQDPNAGCCTSCCCDPRERCCGGPSKPPLPGQVPGCLDGCCPLAPGHIFTDKELPPTCCDKAFMGTVLIMLLAAVGVILCCVLPGNGDHVYKAVSALKDHENANDASTAMCQGINSSATLFNARFVPRQCGFNDSARSACTAVKGIGFFAAPTLQTCAEDIFTVTFIQSQISYFRDFAISVFFVLFVLAAMAVYWAIAYNNNAWAVAELVKYGRIPPPMANPPGCCDSCCGPPTGNVPFMQQQQQQSKLVMLPNGQMVPSQDAGGGGALLVNPSNDCCGCCGGPSANTTGSGCCGGNSATPGLSDTILIGGLPRKDYSQTFPILFYSTPQYHFFISVWQGIGLVVALLSLTILYPLLTIVPSWKEHTTGELKDFFVACELKFVIAIFVGVGLTLLPLAWNYILKPLLWVLGVLPWMVYRMCLDPRVVQRPEGFRTSEEILRSDRDQLAKLMFVTTADGESKVTNSTPSIAQSPGGILFNNQQSNYPQQQVNNNNFSLPADAHTNPSTYTMFPPRIFNAMGSDRLARPYIIQAHQIAQAQLLAGPKDGGIVNTSAALTVATLALQNPNTGGPAIGSTLGGVATARPATDLSQNTSTPVKSRAAKSSIDDDVQVRSEFIANSLRFNQNTLYKDVNGRDPIEVYNDLSCCQQLDVFFIDDCSLCGALQRSQQAQTLAQIRLQQEIAAQLEEIRRLREMGANAEAAAGASKRDKKGKSRDKKEKSRDKSREKKSSSRRGSLAESENASTEGTSTRKEKKDKDKKEKEKKSKYRSESKSKKEKSEKREKKHKHRSRSKGRDDNDEDDDRNSSATSAPPNVAASQNLWNYTQKQPGMMSGSTVFMASVPEAGGGTDSRRGSTTEMARQFSEAPTTPVKSGRPDEEDQDKVEKKSKREKKEKSHHKSKDKSASRDKKNKNREKSEKSDKKKEKSSKKEKRSKEASASKLAASDSGGLTEMVVIGDTMPTFTPRE